MQGLVARWRSRLGFGWLLLTFGEFIGWQNLTAYRPQDWLALIIVYGALVGITLDLLVRWYMLERINILLTAGLFGIVHGALISANLPRNLPLSIIVFGTATPTLMFLLAYASFRLLYAGNISLRALYIAAPIVGLFYGIWTRWLPQTETATIPETSLNTLLPYTILMLAVSGLLLFVLPLSTRLDRLDWLLTPYEGAACVTILMVLLVTRATNDQISTFALILSTVLVALLIGLARFYRTLSPISPRWSMPIAPSTAITIRWLVLLVPFGLAAILGYNLPNTDTDSIQATLMVGGLLFFGILWPPLLSFFVSMQAFIELGRQEF